MERTTEIPLSLNDLAPETREWLLRKSAAVGVSPQSIMLRTLDDASLRERTSPRPTVPPMPTTSGKAA